MQHFLHSFLSEIDKLDKLTCSSCLVGQQMFHSFSSFMNKPSQIIQLAQEQDDTAAQICSDSTHWLIPYLFKISVYTIQRYWFSPKWDQFHPQKSNNSIWACSYLINKQGCVW